MNESGSTAAGDEASEAGSEASKLDVRRTLGAFLAYTILSLLLLVACCVGARAEVSLDGTFLARQSCPALQSINRQTNPGDISVTPGSSYQVIAKNKDVLELRRIEVELTKAQRWNGALPTSVYGSAPIPFMNVGNAAGK